MTFPNALMLKPDAWRASRHETPCGGLTPMGVHAVDGMIDLCGPIDHVFAQSFHRVVPVDADDTTSILFRMKEGMSGYLGTMTATGPGLQLSGVRFQRLGAPRRHDACGRGVFRRAPHALVRGLQISTYQRAGGNLGSGAAGRHARFLEAFARAAQRRSRLSDTDR